MTKTCEHCQGKGYLLQGEAKITCYVCKGVGRRKYNRNDLRIQTPRLK